MVAVKMSMLFEQVSVRQRSMTKQERISLPHVFLLHSPCLNIDGLCAHGKQAWSR